MHRDVASKGIVYRNLLVKKRTNILVDWFSSNCKLESKQEDWVNDLQKFYMSLWIFEMPVMKQQNWYLWPQRW